MSALVATTTSAVIQFPIEAGEVTDVAIAAPADSSYQAVRFNAVKHGILSRSTVLPHEDAAEFADLRDLMSMSAADIAESQRDTRHDLAASEKAAAILRKGGENAYDKALRALLPDSRDWWQNHVDDEEYPATAEGLADFISLHLIPICIELERQARYHEAIRLQAIGEGLQVQRLEKLTRYETHLDRKFERTLAMLVKLKELRATR